ncbi:MAG: menaquinone biosynthesis protein [Gemmatimonadetes bacterium]|nr:menaquinone biosynthesis protein [Gemmatimonadota bacterium]
MIRLGHIDYSNCVPVHALLLEKGADGVELVRDVPSRLNAALASGAIDVAPCSSIEFARHADEYSILPGLAIGSAGAVQSILLESTVPLDELDGATVAIPTASATSVVLLRVLLELRTGVRPRYQWFDQAGDDDPLTDGAAAALRIGDIALRRIPPPGRTATDLGAEWWDWTGLPFAFAVWQVRRDADAAETSRLAGLLRESLPWFETHAADLATRYAPGFGLASDRLLRYWHSLRFDLDLPMQQGLLHFYDLASRIDEAPRITSLDILDL